MAYEQKPNSFSLFKNDKKEKDSHPDYKGSFVDDQGREYFCDAWIKEGKSGKFMSGRVKLKDKQRGQSTPPAQAHSPAPVAPQSTATASSDIPF